MNHSSRPTPGDSGAPVALDDDHDAARAAHDGGFATLGLDERVLCAVEEAGYAQPSPVQAATIPHVLRGADLVAQAETGSGKTAAFACPLLSCIDLSRREPQVLVLAPTRELAMQVSNAVSSYARHIDGFGCVTLYGGAAYDGQIRALRRGVQVVVGTPGRVMDHVRRGTLALDQLSALVLDEADEMLRMGFIDDVEWLLERTPKARQVLLFSATMPAPIRRIAERYLREPVEIALRGRTATNSAIRQRYLVAPQRDKAELLARLLEVEPTDGVIVFTATKARTVELADFLATSGLRSVALNGDIPQPMRERSVAQFKRGGLDVLVATDVAARGLDVERVSHVVNFDFPHDVESYVHRIGRTGRAGRTGEAVLFAAPKDRHRLRRLEHATRQPLEMMRPPSADEIRDARSAAFKAELLDAASAASDLDVYERALGELVDSGEIDMARAAAALASMLRQNKPLTVKELQAPPDERNGRGRAQRSDRGFDRPQRDGHRVSGGDRPAPRFDARSADMQTWRLPAGRAHGVGAKNVVGAIANETGLPSCRIGRIELRDDHALVDLPADLGGDFFRTLSRARLGGQRLRLVPSLARDANARAGNTRAPAHTAGRKPRKARPDAHAAGRKPSWTKRQSRQQPGRANASDSN